MAAHWDYFDKIYCISTVERPDRQQAARSQFANVGLGSRVEFVIVPRHPVDCEQGIYASHMLCMAKGVYAGAEQILIFEDDIRFDRFSAATLKNCIDFISSGHPWHMIFLGCMVRGSQRTAHPSMIKIRYRSLTHAYAIHRRFAQRLVANQWHGVAYDDFLKNLNDDRMFAVYPSFAFQSNSRSDNARYLPLDKFRRLLGGLHSLQKKNEFYHHNRWIIIGVHVIALIIIMLAI